MLRGWLAPMLAAKADSIVLACSHYPFVIDTIRRITGPEIKVIDPSPAVARHLGRILTERGLCAPADQASQHQFFTTGDCTSCQHSLHRLIGREARIHSATWDEDGNLSQLS
jgi:glutamate racemase